MPLDKTPWTDDTILPWGVNKNTALKDVPADYLLWFFKSQWAKDWPGLYAYIEANLDRLTKEVGEVVKEPEGEMESWDDYMESR